MIESCVVGITIGGIYDIHCTKGKLTTDAVSDEVSGSCHFVNHIFKVEC